MKKSRFTETQIVSILKQYDGGTAAADFAESMVSARRPCTTGRQSMAAWKPVSSSVLRNLSKRITNLSECMLTSAFRGTHWKISLKKALTPEEKRQAVACLQERQVSLRQACMLMGLSSSVYYYKPKVVQNDAPIQDELKRLAEEHRRLGFWKMFHYLRGQAQPWNHKRVCRIYTQMNLNIRRKPKKRLPSRTKEVLHQPELPNQVWSVDFMFDRLSNGRSFRTLTKYCRRL